MATNTMGKEQAERIIGLSGRYDKQQLRKAYLKMMSEWHPDVAAAHGHDPVEAEGRTKQLNEAFVTLNALFKDGVATIECDPEHAAGVHGPATGAAGAGDAGHAAAASPAARPAARPSAASIRYTQIVSNPLYVRLFLSGAIPHAIWAAISVATMMFVCSLLGDGWLSLFLGGAWVVPAASVAIDLAFGVGRNFVAELADLFAIRRAVRSARRQGRRRCGHVV